MRRSTQVLAPILASAAVALLAGCHDPQRCVDEQNHPVDPKFCANLPPGAQQRGTPVNGGGFYGANHIFFPHMYRYYYGGSLLNGLVSGGSYVPVTGHSYSINSGTTRGGFGSSFGEGGHGGGE